MTDKKFTELKRKITYSQVKHLLEELIDSISTGKVKLCQDLLHDMFLVQLKYSYDFSLCWDVLTELKGQVFRFNILYDLNLDDEIESKFKLDTYANIQEMYVSIYNILMLCTEAALKNGNGMGHISQAAIKYIKGNYYNNITLNDISDYIKVVPTYISEIFNKEVGMSIPQYLTKFRIQKSKKIIG